MKQTLTVDGSGFAELLEFITPTSTLFPPWPGFMSHLVQYEDWVRAQKLDNAIESLVTGVGPSGIRLLTTELRAAMSRFCPGIIAVLQGTDDIECLPPEYDWRFPLQDIYRIWATVYRWPLFLHHINNEHISNYGLIHYPVPQTCCVAGGLEVDQEGIHSLYPHLSDVTFLMRDDIAPLVSSILHHNEIPVCFKSKYSPRILHPWVALLCETLTLVGNVERGITRSVGTQLAAIKRVVSAFVNDRVDFAWAPRIPHRFSPKVTQKMWFQQVAESMQYDFPSGHVRLLRAEHFARLRGCLDLAMDHYYCSKFYCGASVDNLSDWVGSVTRHIMHYGPPIAGIGDYKKTWVAILDQEIVNQQLIDRVGGYR